MRIRNVLTPGIALSCLVLAGCGGGGSSGSVPAPKLENLTEADRAAFDADMEKARNAEAKDKEIEAASENGEGGTSEDAERAERKPKSKARKK